MANRSILHYPANLNIDNLENAQSAPKVASFTDRDNDWAVKASFYPDYGATGNLFSANEDVYQEIADKKEKMEEFLLNQDWDERAKTMLERKEEWHKLGFFEQSEWKTKFFGIDKERFKMVLWK